MKNEKQEQQNDGARKEFRISIVEPDANNNNLNGSNGKMRHAQRNYTTTHQALNTTN